MWTLDATVRCDYVRAMTRLSVWYVRTLLERGEISGAQVETALLERVNLFRFSQFWDGEQSGDNGASWNPWRVLTRQVAELLLATPMAESAAMEEQALALLWPVMAPRIALDTGPPPVRPFGCWTYQLGWAGLGDRPGLLGKLRNRTHLAAEVRRRLGMPTPRSSNAVLHFMNVLAPASPFADTRALAAALRVLIADIRQEQPQVDTLWCNTWLNDHPALRQIFPPVWFAQATLAPPGNYRNWWGQFARRDGSFHAALAQRFRNSGGVFPFRALECRAGIGEIDAFLAE